MSDEIRLILDELQKINGRLDKMDDRFDKIDDRLDKMDDRLDKMDNRLDKMDNRMDGMVTKEDLRESENMILSHIDHVQEVFDKRFEKLEKNMEELCQYYRITKLENENTTLLLRMIEELRKDVEDLKRKTA